ncbi:Alpha-D-kanosaminyltransferase [Kordia antarctica]|uniref:Alpha-D-kanosaminyltransferase n=1 Tax=Kordia antarctica TaxID=1218801 RepID=A0A7L4ZNP8_9FLAO|nr:glycosyltransferase [Kordia antarctica]QHI38121.1 Alpha-D-kanosaminyltransferase [Kordia antarctica]
MKTTNQHIVFLTPGFAESESDSTTIPALQVFLKSLRKALPKAKLTLLTFQFPFTKKKYDWHGIEVIPLNGQNKKLKKLWTWKKASKTLEKLHKKKNIDTIHSFWIGECSRIGERFSQKHNINHVVTVMGQDASIENSYAKNLINSNAKMVTLSENHQAELLKTYNLDSTIIPWYLDVAEFPKLQENTIDILGVGSLNTIKNYSDFIEIISAIAKTYKNLNVVIIGDGTLKTEIETEIEKEGLQNTITLLGKLPRTEVLEKMAQANILLHTSFYESFGFVFLEGLYSGMQLVSYDVGLAKTSENWNVGNSKTELIEACKTLLSTEIKTKNRIELSSEKQSINAYLNLYYA